LFIQISTDELSYYKCLHHLKAKHKEYASVAVLRKH